MRLTTIRLDGDTHAGRVDDDRVVLLPHRDVGELLASGPDWRERAAIPTTPSVPLAEADFAPLTPRPEKIICVGVNYADHIAEVGLPTPTYMPLFAKYSRSLIGAYDDIVLPPQSHAVDWEVELGVVIGSPARHVSAEDALATVAGYTVVNDVTMRDWQLRTSQFLQGKTFEACTPVGPFLVTPDEVDHARALAMSCAVDDTVMQKSTTGDMLFPVAEIISYVSSIITLVPGDLIATGTPAGIGAARKPPVFLTAGQTLRTAIAGLGDQANRCVTAEPAA